MWGWTWGQTLWVSVPGEASVPLAGVARGRAVNSRLDGRQAVDFPRASPGWSAALFHFAQRSSGRRQTSRMIRNRPKPHATHFRLTEDSWKLIAEAYRNGATARELAAKWKVSPTTIYRYACRDGFTKKHHSDAIARANARKWAEEEAAGYAALGMTEEYNEARRLAGLAPVDPPPPPPAPDADPPAMRRRALEDMSRAMASGRIAEAERLGRLVGTLDRIGGGGGGGPSGSDDDEDSFENGAPGFIEPGLPYDHPRMKAWRRFAKAQGREQDLKAEEAAERLWPLIRQVATAMLGDACHGPALFSRAVLKWRKENLGPEVAQRDYESLQRSGAARHYYDEDGAIREGWDLFSYRWAKDLDLQEQT